MWPLTLEISFFWGRSNRDTGLWIFRFLKSWARNRRLRPCCAVFSKVVRMCRISWHWIMFFLRLALRIPTCTFERSRWARSIGVPHVDLFNAKKMRFLKSSATNVGKLWLHPTWVGDPHSTHIWYPRPTCRRSLMLLHFFLVCPRWLVHTWQSRNPSLLLPLFHHRRCPTGPPAQLHSELRGGAFPRIAAAPHKAFHDYRRVVASVWRATDTAGPFASKQTNKCDLLRLLQEYWNRFLKHVSTPQIH